jgi:hypothetical protein
MGFAAKNKSQLELHVLGTSGKLEEECIPDELKENTVYPFLTPGQNIYPLDRPIPLKTIQITDLKEKSLAEITIEEATHYLKGGRPYTRGLYIVNKVH